MANLDNAQRLKYQANMWTLVSKFVNLDQLHHFCLYQKLGNIFTFITLQLNHLT
jgi:hypothetical protein